MGRGERDRTNDDENSRKSKDGKEREQYRQEYR